MYKVKQTEQHKSVLNTEFYNLKPQWRSVQYADSVTATGVLVISPGCSCLVRTKTGMQFKLQLLGTQQLVEVNTGSILKHSL